jgi:hypothetical protein
MPKRPKTHRNLASSSPKPDSLVHGSFPLPQELILEIISYFATKDYIDDDEIDAYFVCQAALRALSQTCRLLRSICLPALWEYLVCCYRDNDDGVEYLSTKLRRMTFGLTENPTLAPYVRWVVFLSFSHPELDFFPHTSRRANINIVCDSYSLISKFVACLSLLPNMHTLIIICWSSPVSQTFSGARFPQVRRLIIPPWEAERLLPCFPRVRVVISKARIKGWSNLMDLFDESGETLEEIDGFAMSPDSIKCMFL